MAPLLVASNQACGEVRIKQVVRCGWHLQFWLRKGMCARVERTEIIAITFCKTWDRLHSGVSSARDAGSY